MTTYFISVNFVATGTRCTDRRAGQILLTDSYGNVLIQRVLSINEVVIDPLTKITGLTESSLQFGFCPDDVQNEIINLLLQTPHDEILIYCSNDLKQLTNEFQRLFSEPKFKFLNFSSLLQGVDEDSFYYSVKEFGKTILNITTPRTFNNLYVLCNIMKEGILLFKTYNPVTLVQMMKSGRQIGYALYVPFVVFNGICFSRYNKTKCVCENKYSNTL